MVTKYSKYHNLYCGFYTDCWTKLSHYHSFLILTLKSILSHTITPMNTKEGVELFAESLFILRIKKLH